MTTQPVIRRRPYVEAGSWPEHMPILLQQIHAARGASCIEDAHPTLKQLLPPGTFTGMSDAVALLEDAIASDRRILIVGDFDCDGATACAVGVRGLRILGARHVFHAVANRQAHGYGLSPLLVSELADLKPDVLITVDHGIACHAGVAAAKARGWQVLVTDHHLPAQTLPVADVIINPNQAGDAFPSKALAGVGVMFYVLLALRQSLRTQERWAEKEPDLSELLDLVAVGTIADLVPLDVNNRALVAAGLRRLRAGRGCAGLRALIRTSGCDVRTLTTQNIAYAIAPRINAAGRLEDMALGIECLLSDDPTRAQDIAKMLDSINSERRGLQRDMVEAAERVVGQIHIDAAPLSAICLYDPAWHPGVVGLVAAKIKEQAHRPTVAFAPRHPGSDSLRGSARSIPGVHIRDALAAVHIAYPGLIDKFGGHAMAAGLSVSMSALSAFRDAFDQQIATMLSPNLLRSEIWSDGELADDQFDRMHAELLRDGSVWGQHYPEPQFDGIFDIVDWKIVGERHLKLMLKCGSQTIPAIHFNGWDGTTPLKRIHIAYRLAVDDWRGGEAFQLVIVHRAALA